MNAKKKAPDSKPEVIKESSVAVTIYTTRNRTHGRHPATGEKELKSEPSQFTLVYDSDNRRIKRKFANLESPRSEAGSSSPSWPTARLKVNQAAVDSAGRS